LIDGVGESVDGDFSDGIQSQNEVS
jgi:hypothetical protein